MDHEQKKRLKVIIGIGVLLLIVVVWLIGQEDKLWEFNRWDGRFRWLDPDRHREPPQLPFG